MVNLRRQKFGSKYLEFVHYWNFAACKCLSGLHCQTCMLPYSSVAFQIPEMMHWLLTLEPTKFTLIMWLLSYCLGLQASASLFRLSSDLSLSKFKDQKCFSGRLLWWIDLLDQKALQTQLYLKWTTWHELFSAIHGNISPLSYDIQLKDLSAMSKNQPRAKCFWINMKVKLKYLVCSKGSCGLFKAGCHLRCKLVVEKLLRCTRLLSQLELPHFSRVEAKLRNCLCFPSEKDAQSLRKSRNWHSIRVWIFVDNSKYFLIILT